jgi:hypothetical protein
VFGFVVVVVVVVGVQGRDGATRINEIKDRQSNTNHRSELISTNGRYWNGDGKDEQEATNRWERGRSKLLDDSGTLEGSSREPAASRDTATAYRDSQERDFKIKSPKDLVSIQKLSKAVNGSKMDLDSLEVVNPRALTERRDREQKLWHSITSEGRFAVARF